MTSTTKRLAIGAALVTGAVLILAAPALAQDAVPLEEQTAAVRNDLDTAFIFLCGVLVFFMGAGFALVETGLSRAKSAAHMMMKNLITAAIGVLAFWAVGFAIAYGNGNDFLGTAGWFSPFAEAGFAEDGVFSVFNGYGVDVAAMWFFQAAFAATAATIISGAMAERTKLQSYIVVTVVVTAVIYPIVVHWHWGGGWLAQLGFHDFAGSTIVHMTGGVAGLVGTAFLGPRLGKYDRNGKPRVIPGHNIPFAVIGTFILWIGWFGFNPGSQLNGVSGDGTPFSGFAPVIGTTVLAGAVGGVVSMIVSWLTAKKPDVSITANGVLAGLVSITAGAGFVTNTSAVIIGAIGGVLVVYAVRLIDLRFDDPVGAVAVHGVCGAWGTIAVGLFANYAGSDGQVRGLLTGGGAGLLADQIVGVLAVGAFVAVTSTILFFVVKQVMGLRVSAEDEMEGLDIAEHGSPAYGGDISTSDMKPHRGGKRQAATAAD